MKKPKKEEINKILDQTEEEIQNLKYLQKVTSINSYIIFVYVFIYVFVGIFLFEFIPYNVPWYMLLLVFFVVFEVCYTAGWVLTFPLRLWTFSICKKRGVLSQPFKPWLVDWMKVLLINLVFTMPLISIVTTFCYYQHEHTFYILIVIGVSVIIIRIIKMYLTLFFIHGFYKLNEGDKYLYWKDVLAQHNLKEYPVMIIPIEAKAKWANAFAFGWKNCGFIYTTDVLLNNLTDKQFAAILAHETAHLENNDIPKRMIPILTILLLFIIFFATVNSFSLDIFIAYNFILVIAVLIIAFTMSKSQNKQERRADEFSKKILGSGKYMVDALEFLYDVNKMPKGSKGGKYLKKFSNHPTFEERKKELLDGN